jgi:hypothetical protein
MSTDIGRGQGGGSQHQNQHRMVPNHLKKANSMLQQGRPSVPRTIDYQEDTELFIFVVRSLQEFATVT